MGMSEWVHREAERVTQKTDKAICFIFSGRSIWIPKSVLDDADRYDVGDQDITVSVKEWWASKNEFRGDDE